MNEYKNPEGYADPTAYHAIKNIQGEEMERGAVIKYSDSRGCDVLFVVLGGPGEVATGLQLFPTARRDAVPVYGMFVSPSRIRFIYYNNIPDYGIDGYLSDSDLKALLAAVGAYLGFEVVAGEETTAEAPKPVKTAPAASDARIVELETDARIYKGLYEALLAKVTA